MSIIRWLYTIGAYATGMLVYVYAFTVAPWVSWPVIGLIFVGYAINAVTPYGSVRRYIWAWRYAWRVYQHHKPAGPVNWLAKARRHNARSVARHARQRIRTGYTSRRYPLLPVPGSTWKNRRWA